MTVNFYIDRKTGREDKPIFCYVRGFNNGKQIKLFTGERVAEKYWDVKKQKVTARHSEYTDINSYLDSYKSAIMNIHRELFTQNSNYSFEDLQNKILDSLKNNNTDQFFKTYDEFIEIRKPNLGKEMINKFLVLRNHLIQFESTTSYKLTFQSIDMMFYDKFSHYLLVNKSISNNTIAKLFTMLKTFLNWCKVRNVKVNDDYKNFKLKTNQVDIVTLTEVELHAILNLDLRARPFLDEIRDIFVFACFTGGRFSDVSAIKPGDIRNNTWHLRVKKTADILQIPLSTGALAILYKYKDRPYVLPKRSNQKVNENIKEICKIAKIDTSITTTKYKGAQRIDTTKPKYEFISSHTARRTFVTLSLEKGMRPEVIMSLTGHHDYKTFKKYIKITDTVKAKELNEVWK